MKKMQSLTVALLSLVLVLSLTNPALGAKKITLGLVVEHLGNPFYSALKTAAEAEAKKQGVEITALGVEFSTDIESQVRIIEDFIAKRVDVIGYAAVDKKGLVSVLQKAKAAGIPTIAVDTVAEWDGDATYISTDNVLGGYYAGYWLANAIGKEGKIAVIEGKPSSVNFMRLDGFMEALKDFPDVQVAVKVPAMFRRDLGLQVTEDVLTGHPEIEGIFFLNDEMALGGIQAIRTRGKLEEIKTIGYNGVKEAIQEVWKGNLDADVVQFPEIMGKLFVVNALKVLKGQKLPKFINSGVGVVDQALLRKVVPNVNEIK